MPILKYRINGQWVELSGGADAVEVDSSLSQAGKAADAKAAGDAIKTINNNMAGKQNKLIFNPTQPSNWSNGDVWLKPAE